MKIFSGYFDFYLKENKNENTLKSILIQKVECVSHSTNQLTLSFSILIRVSIKNCIS